MTQNDIKTQSLQMYKCNFNNKLYNIKGIYNHDRTMKGLYEIKIQRIKI